MKVPNPTTLVWEDKSVLHNLTGRTFLDRFITLLSCYYVVRMMCISFIHRLSCMLHPWQAKLFNMITATQLIWLETPNNPICNPRNLEYAN